MYSRFAHSPAPPPLGGGAPKTYRGPYGPYGAFPPPVPFAVPPVAVEERVEPSPPRKGPLTATEVDTMADALLQRMASQGPALQHKEIFQERLQDAWKQELLASRPPAAPPAPMGWQETWEAALLRTSLAAPLREGCPPMDYRFRMEPRTPAEKRTAEAVAAAASAAAAAVLRASMRLPSSASDRRARAAPVAPMRASSPAAPSFSAWRAPSPSPAAPSPPPMRASSPALASRARNPELYASLSSRLSQFKAHTESAPPAATRSGRPVVPPLAGFEAVLRPTPSRSPRASAVAPAVSAAAAAAAVGRVGSGGGGGAAAAAVSAPSPAVDSDDDDDDDDIYADFSSPGGGAALDLSNIGSGGAVM